MSEAPVNATNKLTDEQKQHWFYCAALLDYMPQEEKAQIFSEEFQMSRVCCIHCAGNCWPEA